MAQAAMHEMHSFLIIAARCLSRPVQSTLSLEWNGDALPEPKRSSSTFTLFGNLACNAVYHRDALPFEADLSDKYIADFAWASLGPVPYDDIAHILIPRFFTQEILASDSKGRNVRFVNEWEHEQNIEGLSKQLNRAAIEHRLTEHVLEIKRF